MQKCWNIAEEHNKTQKLFQILNQTQFGFTIMHQIQLSVGFASADQM